MMEMVIQNGHQVPTKKMMVNHVMSPYKMTATSFSIVLIQDGRFGIQTHAIIADETNTRNE
jgi:hypothetical protein